MALFGYGADGPNKLYGQDVSQMGVGWSPEMTGSQDPRIGQNTAALGASANGVSAQDIYRQLGFTGDVMIPVPIDDQHTMENYGGSQMVNPAFTQWLASKGYTPVSKSNESGSQGALQDAGGNLVPGSERQWGSGSDDAFGIAALLAGIGGGALAASGAGVGAGGAAASSQPTMGFSMGGANASLGAAGSPAAQAGLQIGGAEAAGGTGLAASPGAGYGLAASTGTGAGLSAAPGAGLQLAATTGTGAGLASGTGAGIIGSGLGDIAGGLSAAQLAQYGATAAGGTGPSLSDLLTGTKGVGAVGTALAGAGAAAVNGANSGSVGTPNYGGAADSQGLSARTDQTNPYGSLSYTQTGVDAQGHPVYSQNVALNPQGQTNLTSAQQAQGTALGNWNDVLKNAGVSWGNIPGVYGDAGSQAALTQQAQDAAYSQQQRYLDPQYQQQQQQLTSQLANQGVTMGSQAYTTAMNNFARQRDSAYGNARDSSISQGNALANQLFNQGVTAHNTGVNDWTTQLGTSGNAATTAANNANSFNPTFAAPPASTNYIGASALQGAGNLNQYNATTGANNSTTNGLFNLGGAVLSNPSWTSLIGDFFKNNGTTTPG